MGKVYYEKYLKKHDVEFMNLNDEKTHARQHISSSVP